MSTQEIYWSVNIKYLRIRQRLSQEALAEKLGISRVKLNAHESGRTANPTIDDMINFSEYFRMSIDSLLKIDLTRLSEQKIKDLEQGSELFMKGSQIRVLAITVDRDDVENIEYVPVQAKAGYRSGYADPDFLAKLPRFNFPTVPKNGTFRMFPTVGDSMLPVPEGADIITRYVQDWTKLKAGTPCIVILKGEQDFVFKQVTINKDGTLLLQSFNKQYFAYTVPITEVIELWEYYSFHSKALPDPQTDMQQLMKMLQEMKTEITEIKGQQTSK
ncbi:XRE family transcriptional regulator [Dyadobacter sandarakinus]|uniref:Helix-turn-helix domain-containing protein n=1 Tax=Dyadobacter sandarakinus TaxID=2747268 RepID=A0ABX7I4D4_9BACT|nr:helix-turn-helix domain-containing protein [Dyadobacter sandarakinus]QRR00964.1 helix-turn-helix domain-containing protein [Dyadobacter sandarakinus]